MSEYGDKVAKKMEDYMGNPDSVSEEIHDIQNAMHGVDVRGALAAGVKKSFSKSESAEGISKNTEQRQTAVEQQFDDVLNEWTGDKPISNEETIAARTNRETGQSWSTLGQRMDAESKKVNEQLADTGINVRSFVNDFSDTTEAIRAAEQVAFELEKPLFFPKGYVFNTSDTIFIRENIDVIMHSPIIFDSAEDKPALVIGTRGTVNYAEELILQVERKNQSNWEGENDIGVQLINCNTTKIIISKVVGFTIGLEALGSGTGFVYSQLYLGKFFNNKIHINLTNETFENKMGWCNENSFFGGRFSNFNKINEGKDRYAVRITRNKGEPFNYNNNNVFYKPSFELNQIAARDAEALPVLIEFGRYNRFYDLRDENNGDYLARVADGSYYNYFSVGYSDTDKKIDDMTSIVTNKIEQARDLTQNRGTRLLFSSGNMVDNSNIYDTSNNNLFIPYLSAGTTSNSQVYMSRSDIKKFGQFIEVSGSTGLGVFVETTQVKTFTINYSTQNNYHGRLFIVCYDASGNIITNEHLIKQHDIRQQTIQSTYFGGAARINLDGYSKTFTLDDSVKRIRLLFSGVETFEPIRIKSFSISSDCEGDAAISTGLEGRLQPGLNYALNKPPNGIYEPGKVIYNVSVGSPGAPIGWISYGSTNKIMVEFGQVSKSVSISEPPNFIGQEALSGGHWYKAIGTSSSADWKRITN